SRDTLAVAESATVANLVARSVQIIKENIYKNGALMGGTDTVRPGDSLEYQLQIDVSDFFRTGDVVVTEELPDGMTFDKDFNPTLTVNWKNAAGYDQAASVAFDPANVEVRSADGSTWTPLTDFSSDLP